MPSLQKIYTETAWHKSRQSGRLLKAGSVQCCVGEEELPVRSMRLAAIGKGPEEPASASRACEREPLYFQLRGCSNTGRAAKAGGARGAAAPA